jgi:hypothetical protein
MLHLHQPSSHIAPLLSRQRDTQVRELLQEKGDMRSGIRRENV